MRIITGHSDFLTYNQSLFENLFLASTISDKLTENLIIASFQILFLLASSKIHSLTLCLPPYSFPLLCYTVLDV